MKPISGMKCSALRATKFHVLGLAKCAQQTPAAQARVRVAACPSLVPALTAPSANAQAGSSFGTAVQLHKRSAKAPATKSIAKNRPGFTRGGLLAAASLSLAGVKAALDVVEAALQTTVYGSAAREGWCRILGRCEGGAGLCR